MKRYSRSEDGAVLIFVLLIITTIAVVTLAVLTKGQGNLRTSLQLRSVAGSSYSADAAAKVAISALQLGENAPDPAATYPPVPDPQKWVYDNYADGSGCFGLLTGPTGVTTPKKSLELKNLYPATGSITSASSARVECEPVTGTGRLGSSVNVPIKDGNSPGRALTLLGTGSGDGLSAKPLGSGNSNRFIVAGGLASNAGITVSNGELFANTYAWARSGCSGTVLTTQPADKDCRHAQVADPGASYAPNVSDPKNLTYRPGPTGACTFSPGYYDDAKALSAWTDACATSVFQPGTYYFDFHNNSADPTYSAKAVTGAGDNVWNINRSVIGGNTTGVATSPGRCTSPIESTAAQGVQFVFGGDSRMYLGASANVELCGTYSASAAPVTVLGLDANGSSGPAKLESPAAISPSSASSSQNGGTWSNVTAARVASADGNAATFVSGNGNNSSGSLTVAGFAPAPAIPAGSMLASAELQITHSESITSGNVAKPTFQIDAGAVSQTFTAPAARSSLGTDTFDVKDTLAAAVHDGKLTAALPSVTLSEGGKNTTFSVDAVRLVLTYYPPTYRAQTAAGFGTTNCLASTCSFIDTKNNWGGTFVVNGVTYVPNGDIAIDPGNGDGLVAFRYGLIAKSLDMKGQPRYTFGYPVVSLPDKGPGFGSNVTAVDLKVYICVGQGSCANGGTLALTSRVKITDPVAPAVPAPGNRKIEIMSWSEQR